MTKMTRRTTELLSATYDALLALAYPQACAVCNVRGVERRADVPACEVCWDETRLFTNKDALCQKCGVPARDVVKNREVDPADIFCRRCDAESFTRARAVGVYDKALRAAVLELKRTPHVGARLRGLLASAAKEFGFVETAERIVPVPLSGEREQERGFNQAAIIGRALERETGLICDEHSLVRAKHTGALHAGMDRQGRRAAVEAAFVVARPRLIIGKNILLVDDVLTTGATVSAAATALLAAGARDVCVLTIARAA